MTALTIEDLDKAVREKLRLRAERHGRSIEAEIREILTNAVADDAPATDLFSALTDGFSKLGGLDLDVDVRSVRPRAARLPD